MHNENDRIEAGRIKGCPEWIAWLPGIFLLTVWPCLMHTKVVRTYLENEVWFPDQAYAVDFFLKIKSRVLLVTAVVMLAVMIWLYVGKIFGREAERKAGKKRYPAPVMILAAVFFLLALISSVVSRWRRFAFFGFLESYETLPVIGAYVVVFLYGFTVYRHSRERLTLVKAFTVGAFIQCLAGIGQLAGHDFWQTGAGRAILYFGSGIRDTDIVLRSGERNQVYLFLFNPNYAAVYLMIAIPFVTALLYISFKTGKRKWMCFTAVTDLLCLICLAGTGSRAALLASVILLPLGALMIRHPGKNRNDPASGKRYLAVMVPLLAAVVLLIVYTADGTAKKILKNIFPGQQKAELEEISVIDQIGVAAPEDGGSSAKSAIRIVCGGITLYAGIDPGKEGKLQFFVYNEDGQAQHLERNEKNSLLYLDGKEYKKLKKRLNFDAAVTDGNMYVLIWHKKNLFRFWRKDDGTYVYLNPAGKADDPLAAKKADLPLDDRALTGRAYIWKRALPLIPGALFTGYGAESFAHIFPQNDYAARSNVGEEMYNGVISKPHSLYLQVCLNNGILALAVFGVLVVMTAVGILKNRSMAGKGAEYTAAFISLIGFMVMGLANDSCVAVTPVMCLMAGAFSGLWEGRQKHV